MAVQTPIPPNPIGENFAWRDWLQKLSDRVFGTASTLNVPIEPQYGGTGLTTYNAGDIIYSNVTNNLTRLAAPASTSLLQMTAAGVPSWTASSGIVTSVTGTSPVASSGGTTPAISLAAAYGDTLNPYASKTANFVLAAPNGSAGVPTFRAVVAADIPTLNQNTSGSAATLTTTRAIYGNNFNGSAALTQVIASTYGGTGNGFTKFTGATTAEKTYTLPDANSTIVVQSGALGTPSSGTLTNCTFPTLNQNTTGTALNITATSNNTLTTLSALSLPNTQITGLGTMSTQNVGISTTVALAKLTIAGTNGSLTVSSGIITAYTAPT